MTSETQELLRIGQLADMTGRTKRTLHFYEELGLLSPAKRTKGGFRLYDNEAALRVSWIDQMQELGFSLSDIRDFLSDYKDLDFGPAAMLRLRSFYTQKLSETRVAISRLRALETELLDSLRYLDTCTGCAPRTPRTACNSCDESYHAGEERPVMVVAVQD